MWKIRCRQVESNHCSVSYRGALRWTVDHRWRRRSEAATQDSALSLGNRSPGTVQNMQDMLHYLIETQFLTCSSNPPRLLYFISLCLSTLCTGSHSVPGKHQVQPGPLRSGQRRSHLECTAQGAHVSICGFYAGWHGAGVRPAERQDRVRERRKPECRPETASVHGESDSQVYHPQRMK